MEVASGRKGVSSGQREWRLAEEWGGEVLLLGRPLEIFLGGCSGIGRKDFF